MIKARPTKKKGKKRSFHKFFSFCVSQVKKLGKSEDALWKGTGCKKLSEYTVARQPIDLMSGINDLHSFSR